ncbi:hypothetical protein CGA21_22500 [Pseudomonas sp. PSB11]|nr:hypothetical protein [Pseudomonas sp. PSB11]
MLFLCLEFDPPNTTNPNVGAGLLAKKPCQSIKMATDTPLSRASPLPQGMCGGAQIACAQKSTPQGASF